MRRICLHGAWIIIPRPVSFLTVHRMFMVYRLSEERLYCYDAFFFCVSLPPFRISDFSRRSCMICLLWKAYFFTGTRMG